MWGMDEKAIYHSHMYNIYECIYIASPVIVYVSTDLFSVGGRRKGSKAVKDSQSSAGGLEVGK